MTESKRDDSNIESKPNVIDDTVGSHGADDWLIDKPLPPHRDPIILREQVLLQLRCIIDPDLYRDIVSLGFVKELQIDFDAKRVAFTLELTTPACPIKDQFVEEATRLIKELGWVDIVDIKLSSRKYTAPARTPIGLSNVSSILAVASCKGGVGKSSIACNVAYMLHHLGARVGLVDVDVYGPSLPTLIPLKDQTVLFSKVNTKKEKPSVEYESSEDDNNNNNQSPSNTQEMEGGLLPLIYEGVKLMSYGYFKSSKNFAAVRGPIASNIVSQMIGQTLWGDLDYLIIDLPPGTGDIHLTISQSFSITAAIMVTTPQQLSLVDVEKGIAMFNQLRIPTIAIVQNMSYFTCPNCNASHHVFTHTATNEYSNIGRLMDQFGVIIQSNLPLHSDFSKLKFISHKGKTTKEIFPFVKAFDSSHAVWAELKMLCENLIRELSTMKLSPERVPDLRMLSDGTFEMTIKHPLPKTNAEKDNKQSQALGSETVLLASSRSVRLNCRCAQCVDEFTGKQRINPRKIPSDVHVTNMKQSGNYAVSMDWSDGHHSLFSFAALAKLFTTPQNTTGSSSKCVDAIEGNQW